MNVNTRLALAFGLALVLLVAVAGTGGVSLYQLNQLVAKGAGAELYTNGLNTMIAVLAVAATLVTVAGFWVARSLRRQLGGEPGEAAAFAHAVAEGDLTAEIKVAPGDTDSLMAQLKLMQGKLAQVVSNVRGNAEGVATASVQIAQGNNDLSTRTEQQASALEQTAASMEELGSTVSQNADNARQANQLAMSASGVAVKGGDVVGQVVETMKGINDSSRKIADIIGVIDGIAFQTNILALNAAVEAARAGEQGRGFAVVASEVRSLAQRSADAAKEIKTLITASVERVEQGTALVDRAGVTMTEVVNSIKRVTDIVGEISAASAEQSSGVSQVGEAVTQMDRTTQQNAALVQQSATAADSLREQARKLVDVVAVFKLAGDRSAAAHTGSSTSQTAPSAARAARPSTTVSAKPAARAAASPRPAVAATPSKPAAPKAARAPANPAPATAAVAAGSDEWETF